MQLGRYRFRPPWWGVVAMLAGVVAFSAAGIWQIKRGQTKELMIAQRTAASKRPPQPLMPALNHLAGPDAATLYYGHFKVRGHYDGHQILLDNQVFQGRVGYRVWTPLVLPDGRRILVDRGWVPLGPGGRDDPPDPSVPQGPVTVSGLLKNLPQPGMRLGDPPECGATVWPRVLNYPTIHTVRCLYQSPVINGVLLLDEGLPHGFARDWQIHVGLSPMRHYGYALQWFALALTVIVVFFVVNMKRMR